MRSKEELQELLEIYKAALDGDPDALILMGQVMLNQSEDGGEDDGKDRIR